MKTRPGPWSLRIPPPFGSCIPGGTGAEGLVPFSTDGMRANGFPVRGARSESCRGRGLDWESWGEHSTRSIMDICGTQMRSRGDFGSTRSSSYRLDSPGRRICAASLSPGIGTP